MGRLNISALMKNDTVGNGSYTQIVKRVITSTTFTERDQLGYEKVVPAEIRGFTSRLTHSGGFKIVHYDRFPLLFQ